MNDEDTAELARLRAALEKINAIRNSIIGLQTINWSEHVYQLVAALEEAGLEGMGYPASRARYGTMLERTTKAEDEANRLRRQLDVVRTPRDDVWIWQGDGHDNVPSLSCPVVMDADTLRLHCNRALLLTEALQRYGGFLIDQRDERIIINSHMPDGRAARRVDAPSLDAALELLCR